MILDGEKGANRKKGKAGRSTCPAGKYLDRGIGLCQPCTACCPPRPINQFCRKDCNLGETCSEGHGLDNVHEMLVPIGVCLAVLLLLVALLTGYWKKILQWWWRKSPHIVQPEQEDKGVLSIDNDIVDFGHIKPRANHVTVNVSDPDERSNFLENGQLPSSPYPDSGTPKKSGILLSPAGFHRRQPGSSSRRDCGSHQPVKSVRFDDESRPYNSSNPEDCESERFIGAGDGRFDPVRRPP